MQMPGQMTRPVQPPPGAALRFASDDDGECAAQPIGLWCVELLQPSDKVWLCGTAERCLLPCSWSGGIKRGACAERPLACSFGRWQSRDDALASCSDVHAMDCAANKQGTQLQVQSTSRELQACKCSTARWPAGHAASTDQRTARHFKPKSTVRPPHCCCRLQHTATCPCSFQAMAGAQGSQPSAPGQPSAPQPPSTFPAAQPPNLIRAQQKVRCRHRPSAAPLVAAAPLSPLCRRSPQTLPALPPARLPTNNHQSLWCVHAGRAVPAAPGGGVPRRRAAGAGPPRRAALGG